MGIISKTIIFLFIFTLGEYLFGFLKTVLIADNFGVSSQTDVYFFAYGILAFLGTLIASSLKTAFVPVFLSTKKSLGERGAWGFALSFGVFWVLLLLCLIGITAIFASPLVHYFVPGFSQSAQGLAVLFLRLLLPVFFLLSVSGLTSALLNSYFNFWLPVLTNFLGAALFIVIFLFFKESLGIYSLVAGAISQFLLIVTIQIFAAIRLKSFRKVHSLNLKFFDARMRLALNLLSPLIIILLAHQVLKYIEYFLVSKTQEGGISILSYARYLSEVPGRMIISIVATVFFPFSSAFFSSQDRNSLILAIKKQLRFIFIVLTPISIFFIIQSGRLVSVIFERGHFTAADVNSTAITLSIFSIGLLSYAVGGVLGQTYFAVQEPKKMILAIICGVFLTAALDFILVKSLSYFGIALGFVIGNIFTNLLLLSGLGRLVKYRLIYPSRFLLKIIFSVVISTLITLPFLRFKVAIFNNPIFNLYADLFLAGGILFISYIFLLILFKVQEMSRGLNFITRKLKFKGI